MPGTGDTGLRLESMAAKNVLEQSFWRDPAVQQDPQLLSALESFRGILNRSQHDAVVQSKGFTTISPAESSSEAPSPDWEQVRAVLERAESRFATYFHTCLHPF